MNDGSEMAKGSNQPINKYSQERLLTRLAERGSCNDDSESGVELTPSSGEPKGLWKR